MARTNVEGIQFHVPIGKSEVIKTEAKKRGFKSVAAYIRHLLEKDINDGLDLTVEVGYGRRKADDEQANED